MGFCACVYVRVETSLRMCVFVEVEGVCGCLCAMRPPKPPTSGQAVTAQLIVASKVRGQWQPACWLTHFNYDGSQRAGLPTSTMMVASVLARTHFNYDGSQRAGFAIWTMAASALAYPLQL